MPHICYGELQVTTVYHTIVFLGGVLLPSNVVILALNLYPDMKMSIFVSFSLIFVVEFFTQLLVFLTQFFLAVSHSVFGFFSCSLWINMVTVCECDC